MALFGRIETVREQAPATAAFAAAWRYVDELQRSDSVVRQRLMRLGAGESEKHELGAGVFVIEQAYATKERSAGFFESHRKYIDIQIVVSGEETMEVIDLAASTVDVPYDETKDLIKHRDRAGASALRVGAGQCAVFFPTDVHMPTLRCGEAALLVHKSVLKLPV